MTTTKKKKMFRAYDVIDELRARAALGSQKELAVRLSISQQYMSEVLSGRRDISKSLALKLGYTRIYAFIPSEPS